MITQGSFGFMHWKLKIKSLMYLNNFISLLKDRLVRSWNVSALIMVVSIVVGYQWRQVECQRLRVSLRRCFYRGCSFCLVGVCRFLFDGYMWIVALMCPSYLSGWLGLSSVEGRCMWISNLGNWCDTSPWIQAYESYVEKMAVTKLACPCSEGTKSCGRVSGQQEDKMHLLWLPEIWHDPLPRNAK